MRITAPGHIRDYCFSGKLTEAEIFDEYKYECSFVYQIQCKCGCVDFGLKQNNIPYVIGICKSCGNEIVIYDIQQYPTSAFESWAVPDEEDTVMRPVTSGEECNLVVNFQYSGEPEISDPEFDPNDLTGFTMWTYENGVFTLVIDDETA